MRPQLGVGGGTPSERKDRPASSRRVPEMPRTAITTIIGIPRGITWRALSREGDGAGRADAVALGHGGGLGAHDASDLGPRDEPNHQQDAPDTGLEDGDESH